MDRQSVYLELDEAAGRLLGLRPADVLGSASFARIPADAEEVWWLEQQPEITPVPLVCCLVPDLPGPAGDRWVLSLTPSPDNNRIRETVRRYAEQAIAAVATRDLDTIVRMLTRVLSTVCEFEGCQIFMINERTGEPVFAGGEGLGHEQLTAMQENRRRGGYGCRLLFCDREKPLCAADLRFL